MVYRIQRILYLFDVVSIPCVFIVLCCFLAFEISVIIFFLCLFYLSFFYTILSMLCYLGLFFLECWSVDGEDLISCSFGYRGRTLLLRSLRELKGASILGLHVS